MRQHEELKDILYRRLAHYGLDKAALSARVCAVAKCVLKESVFLNFGEGAEFEPVSFKSGMLKIAVTSPAVAHVFRLKQKKIIDEINTKLKANLVKKIGFKIESDL